MWSICGSAVTSTYTDHSAAPLTWLVMPPNVWLTSMCFLLPSALCVCVFVKTRRWKRGDILWLKMKLMSKVGGEEFTHHIPLIAPSMWGHKGCCARCEWPQGKASQLGRNAGIGALCRSGSRRALGAVMSAGKKNKIGAQCGTGSAFSGSTPPTTCSRGTLTYTHNVFMHVPTQ